MFKARNWSTFVFITVARKTLLDIESEPLKFQDTPRLSFVMVSSYLSTHKTFAIVTNLLHLSASVEGYRPPKTQQKKTKMVRLVCDWWRRVNRHINIVYSSCIRQFVHGYKIHSAINFSTLLLCILCICVCVQLAANYLPSFDYQTSIIKPHRHSCSRRKRENRKF